MNNDLINKALDQAKALQKTVGEAISKGAEQAHPLIDDALVKAHDLKETLAHGAADATEAAKPHLEGALGHLNHFITLGKGALATGVAKAHEHLEPLAEQLKKTIDSTTEAMGKKAPNADPAPEAAPAPDAAPK
jgi:ABC-type transporter Mla subunit MlaD